ncbi:hypothetical protein HOK021_46260 [Streptomyces hygroscopicus]|nr:hypothetical protein HOK021_46260 [Streptomyces hygroscopicus]
MHVGLECLATGVNTAGAVAVSAKTVDQTLRGACIALDHEHPPQTSASGMPHPFTGRRPCRMPRALPPAPSLRRDIRCPRRLPKTRGECGLQKARRI